MTVQGSIGNESVILENAATESTLQKLLKASLTSADAIKKLAEQAGLQVKDFNETVEDFEEQVEDLNEGLEDLDDTAEDLNEGLEETVKLTDILNTGYEMLSSSIHGLIRGSVSASDMLNSIARQIPPGLFRELSEQIIQLTRYQEENFQSYQKLTESGITFGGALNQIRVAAAQSYMTLDQFTDMYAKNSEVFMKLGGTAEQGAENFAKLSSQLIKSDLGLQLQAMGYTTSQINQSMIDYLDITGGVNASELKNKKVVDGLVESSGEFMKQQDMLARLTGKSREALADEMKKKAQDASYQAALMRMSTEEQAKHTAAMQFATATGIEGAEDYYKSLVLGLPPMTEAGRMFAAMFSGAAGEFDKMAASAKNEKVTIADLRQSFFATSEALINDVDQYSDTTLAALIQQGSAAGVSAQSVMAFTNKLKQAGDNVEEREKAFNEFQAKTLRESKQAENMAKFNESMQKLSAAINESFAPLIGLVANGLALLSYPITALAEVVEKVNEKFPGLVGVVGLLIGGFTALVATLATVRAAVAAKNAVGGMLGGSGNDRGGSRIREVADGGKLKSLGLGIEGLARGLAVAGASAGPMIVGAAALGVAIAAVGAGIGVAIATIAAGIAGATWLMGKALPTLAEGLSAFTDIDGKNLTNVGIGVAALGAGLAALGAGSVAASVGSVLSGLVDGLGSLFGVKSPTEKLNEFARLGPGLAEASSGLNGFTSALDKLINFDFNKVSAAADSIKKLSKTIKDVKIDQDIKKLSNSFDSITKIIGPMNTLNELSNSGTSFGRSSVSIDQYIKSIEKLSQLDISKLSSIGKNLKDLGQGLEQIGKGTGNSLSQTMSQKFNQLIGTKTPIDQINDYIKISNKLTDPSEKINNFVGSLTKLVQLNLSRSAETFGNFVSSLGGLNKFNPSESSEKINSFIGSLSGLTDIDLSSIGSLISNLSNIRIEFENLASNAAMPQDSMQTLIDKLEAFKDLDVSTEKIKEFSTSIENLSSNMKTSTDVSGLLSQFENTNYTVLNDLSTTFGNFGNSLSTLSLVDYTSFEKGSTTIQNLADAMTKFKTLDLNSQTFDALLTSFDQLALFDNGKLDVLSNSLIRFIDNLNNETINSNSGNLSNIVASVEQFSQSIESLNTSDQSNIGVLSSNLSGLTQAFNEIGNSTINTNLSEQVGNLLSDLNTINQEVPLNGILGAYETIGSNLDVTTQKLESFMLVMKQLLDLNYENLSTGIGEFSKLGNNLPNEDSIANIKGLLETKPKQLNVPQLENTANIKPSPQGTETDIKQITTGVIAENDRNIGTNQTEIIDELRHFTKLAEEMVLYLSESNRYQRKIASAARSGGGLW